MGKALIFSGVAVANPLQTVKFVTPLVTANDYVTKYSSLATEVTTLQKGYLETFVNTLISNSIWDKVIKCYPMLGGMAGYKYDLKDVKNQVNWGLPILGTTWDSIRNAPYTNPIGNDAGINLPISTIDENNFCLIFGHKQKDDSSRYPLSVVYTDNTKIILTTKQGGYRFPQFNTASATTSLLNYLPTNSNIFLLNYNSGNNGFKVKSGNSLLLDALTPDVITKQISYIQFWKMFGGERVAPAPAANYGNTNIAIITTGLTEQEMTIIADAIDTFNESCGRNIAW